MLTYVTAGESHGAGLHAIVTGLPKGLRLDRAFLDTLLARRQGGYGRSERQRLPGKKSCQAKKTKQNAIGVRVAMPRPSIRPARMGCFRSSAASI